MKLDVKCHCGMVHRLEVGESATCQCGAVVRVRKSAKGNITPWAHYATPGPKGSHGAPQIVKKPHGWTFVTPRK